MFRIGEAFRSRFGEKAGWAHQILFAGDLVSFREVISESKKRKLEEEEDKEP
jgi:hypothetical protein